METIEEFVARIQDRLATGQDAEADVPGALGWKKGKFALISNKSKLTFSGGIPLSIVTAPPPIRMRQTVRVGDDCATGVLECTLNGAMNVLKCTTPIFP